MSICSGKYTAQFIEHPGKISPSGVDLVPTQVLRMPIDSVAVFDGKERTFKKPGTGRTVDIPVADYEKVVITEKGRYLLREGVYLAKFPKVKIPLEVTGIAFPRSSLLRLGVLMFPSAIWDSGFEGEGMAVFQVLPECVEIGIDEAWIQLVFFQNLEKAETGYDGFYQKDGVKT